MFKSQKTKMFSLIFGLLAGAVTAGVLLAVAFDSPSQARVLKASNGETYCMSADDDCSVFQSPQELSDALPNPYEPTLGGTEVVDGQAPPALAVHHNASEQSFTFTYGKPNKAVVNMTSNLLGITQLDTQDDGFTVIYADGTDAAKLRNQIKKIIGYMG